MRDSVMMGPGARRRCARQGAARQESSESSVRFATGIGYRVQRLRQSGDVLTKLMSHLGHGIGRGSRHRS